MAAFSLSQGQRVFLLRASLISVLGYLSALYLSDRVRIGYDGQDIPCLPWRVFVAWLGAPALPDQLVAFRSVGIAPVLPDGTVIVKRVAAVAGDRIRIADGVLYVNDVERAHFSPNTLRALKKSADAFDRSYVLGAGELLVLGDSPVSYDSRYWGPISSSQVMGRAWGVW